MKNQYRLVPVLSLFITLTSLAAGCSDDEETPRVDNVDNIDETSSFHANRVEHLNGQWIAIGANVAEKPYNLALATSDNGRDWTSQVFDAPGVFEAVAYGNGRYVAVGGHDEMTDAGEIVRRRSVAVSSDGRDWEVTTEVVNGRGYTSIAFGAGVFLAATIESEEVLDTVQVHRSEDGVVWERLDTLDATGWYPTLRWNPIDETFLISTGDFVGHSDSGDTWELVPAQVGDTFIGNFDAQSSGMVGTVGTSYDGRRYIVRVDEGFGPTRRPRRASLTPWLS